MLVHFLSSHFLYCFLTDSFSVFLKPIFSMSAETPRLVRHTLPNIHIQVVTYSSLLTITSHVPLLSLTISKETEISQWHQCRLDDMQ